MALKIPYTFFILSILGAISFINAQVVGIAPISVSGAAFARSKTKFFVQGGVVIANGNTVAQQNQLFQLDLAVPWTILTPQWISLKTGPTEAGHSAIISSDDQTLVTFRSLPLSSSGPPSPSSPSLLTSPGATFPAPLPPSVNAPLSYRYNINGNNWDQSSVKVQFPDKEGVTAVEDPISGLVYLAGGYQNDNTQMYVYNAGTDTMTMFPMPSNFMSDRAYYEGVYIMSRKSILYFGGQPGNGQPSQNLISEFVPSSGMWSTLVTTNQNPPHRQDHCMESNDDGTKVVVFGGKLDNGNYARDLWVLDVGSLTWFQGPSWTEPRASLTCTVAGNVFIAWGGTNGQRTVDGTLVLFDLGQNQYVSSFTPPASYINLNNNPLDGSNQHDSSGTLNNNNNNNNNGQWRNGPNGWINPNGIGYNPEAAAEFPDDQGKSNSLAIIGGIMGAVFLLAVGAGAYVLWLRKKGRTQSRCISFENGNNIHDVHTGGSFHTSSGSYTEHNSHHRSPSGRYPTSNGSYRVSTPAPTVHAIRVNKDGLTPEEEKELSIYS